ncbi:mRNA cap guanine-N7 methyltransferase 2-like isoform X2 [Glycine soja]|uniref:mRNA cap guanine-N7 methyltransferase 2-like isoform X2 n=1 Tax=Glycine soja TaxID=3848 RepID=UPI0003DED2B8|nr:mRNA cap guanine-N7 methyltransferase 2-like isoform X2 [Glycine soja]|eukprot:XP_006578920.1 mRNA cap guanine-N7 methyltransferase 2 isoform X2 [Glycine max]
MSQSTQQRLYDFAKMALINIFAHPYATVCDLYCGDADADKWVDAQIGHYIGIDAPSSGIEQMREAWEIHRKSYTAEFFELDPCTNTETHLEEKTNVADVVCCLQHLQLCFETEEKARKLLHNVSSLLKPGGYFLGITPDSSTIWAKYQRNVEAYHNKSSSMKPNIVPNCIRTENYMITFEVEEEKFPLFGKKYQLKFANDVSAETHCLVHFPSFIRLAREAGLEYVEIQNLTEFYDDNRAQLAGLLTHYVPNLLDPRGRLLPRSYDALGLYTTFIFQKPDPEIAPPIATPLLPDVSYNLDEVTIRPDDEIINGHAVEPAIGLGKISEQKGILGPGPADLRFPEAL